MANTENLMSDLKSQEEDYFRKTYTQEHTLKKVFVMGYLRQIDKIQEKYGYRLLDNSIKSFLA